MYATINDAISEYAWNAGQEFPEQAWLTTSYDTIVRNPHYQGPPQPHPDDLEQAYYDELNEQEALDALPEPTWISDPDFVEIYPGCLF
jgi:hypothetical protein